MKFIKAFLALAVIAFSTQAMAQKQMPDVSLKTLEGDVVNIQDYAKNGKLTVISFWATWCSPCKRELDNIAEIFPDWVEAYDVELLAITVDNSRTFPKVKPMVDAKGWEYIVLSDATQDLQRALGFQTVPQTFVLDQEGNIVYTHSGYNTNDEYELEEILEKHSKK